MDKTLLELLKEAKGMDKMNGSQEQKTEDRQQIFNAGFQMGIQKRIFRRKPPRGRNIKSGKGRTLPYPLIYLPDSNMQI